MAFLIIILSWLVSCQAEFTDEMQVYEQTCLGEEKFLCLDGGCILQSQYCDGKSDCVDGTDESFCPDHTPDPRLCHEAHNFLCFDTKACIPITWVCNNNTECEDGSDEGNCSTVLPEPANNTTCKGFKCDGDKCVSPVWTCDGVYDCQDKTDETVEMCRESRISHMEFLDLDRCDGMRILPQAQHKNYRCLDSSFCLPYHMMCNGMKDCRDGSDEGPFCDKWHTICASNPCLGNGTMCNPERSGYSCVCDNLEFQQYNFTTNKCDDVDECAKARPYCSQICINYESHFRCKCEEGYNVDEYGYLCHAKGPEALLFFSTRNEIGYIRVKTKDQVIVATGIKQAHGVSYDGKYLYWVETAQGHQAIMRAQLDNVEETKEIIVSLGLEDPGDVAVDWLGGHIYFSDAERAIISVCRNDGSICTTLKTNTKSPRFVTLAVKYGKMFWADWHHRPVIMTARMDGSQAELLVDTLQTFATGLTVDVPNGRLYYVDHTIKVIKIDDKQTYSLFEEPFHHPYAIAVFENTVYWSDWTSRSIQTADKLHGSGEARSQLVVLDSPVFDMHIYHPAMVGKSTNPCTKNTCSHLCLVSSNETSTCACPDGMELRNTTCYHVEGFRPQYLVVGAGAAFTRVQYNSLGNPESHATIFNIGWVQAMAYDSTRDTLYVYDGQRRTVNSINMSDFTLGVTHISMHHGFMDVVDMDYDYVSDCLYILDAGRRFIEVVSLETDKRVLLHRFHDQEIPVSFCLMPDYGKMLVAVRESEFSNHIRIDSIGMDGSGKKTLVSNDLRGPRVRLRYAHNMDTVYLSDEGNSIIDFMNPEGAGRENFRSLSTSVTGLAVTDTYVFWSDRRTPRLFWADVHDITHRIRRIELSIFPNNTQLHIQASTPPLDPKNPLFNHPCFKSKPCSDVCVQTPHSHSHTTTPSTMGYKCLCPPSFLLVDGKCTTLANCREDQFYCHGSNVCIPRVAFCDGKKDCKNGEDEELCEKPASCDDNQFKCRNGSICVERSQICDGQTDCLDGSDEDKLLCKTLSCDETEFMCTSGSCILKSFKCDGEEDCADGSDEVDCESSTCGLGFYLCHNKQCIEIRKRCDGKPDCLDDSDEFECEESIFEKDEVVVSECAEGEYPCQLNRSICFPATARCNRKVDCPGGTDEHNCDQQCAPLGQFQCKQELKCLHWNKVCNGLKECNDGSDETPGVCGTVNKTSRLFPPQLFPTEECRHGFLCRNRQCLEWRQVCDKSYDCYDGSDESGLCSKACDNHTCEYSCQPTPTGPHCKCPIGMITHDHSTCLDIDECANEVCSQNCHNVPGTFLCSCHHGYALRADRRSCKAIKGSMSILYVSGNSVRSLSADGKSSVEYNDHTTGRIMDIDANVRANTLYVTLPDAGKLIEMNGAHNKTVVTNIGVPTRVAVDWLTGNVYFVDKRASSSYLRVCNVGAKRCAKLQKLPLTGDAKVTALIIDPASRRMYYCITHDGESVVWAASLSGRKVVDLATFGNCTGLAVDSFIKKLFVAETGPAQITRMDFEGDKHKKVLFGHPHLEAPHGLAIFEDWVYFLVANSLKLSRCQLYGSKTCEPYIYRMFDANTFVIRHPSVQRDDLKNICEGYVCSNVCVLDEDGPLCVCDDGSFAQDGSCITPEKSELPAFNGWTHQEYTRLHQVSYTVVTTVLVLFAVFLSIFVYYHFVRKRRSHPTNYMEVRFQNTKSESLKSPVIEMPPEVSAAGYEFTNPLELMRDVWQRSFRRSPKPVGTAGLEIDVSNLHDPSDTESDIDDRDVKRIIK